MSIGLFPTTCFICKYRRGQRNKKDEIPQKAVTYDAEMTIKSAAKEKMLDFYAANKYEDLIAKELHYHLSCYRSFTRGFSRNFQDSEPQTSTENDDVELSATGDFQAVKDIISRQITDGKQAVSMAILHEVYGLGVGNTRYRSKLKARIIREYGNRLSFVAMHANKCELVFDPTLPIHEIDFKNKDGCIEKAAKYLRDDIIKYKSNLPEFSWPPRVEDLRNNAMNMPESLTDARELKFQIGNG